MTADDFAFFEHSICKRGRGWRWSVTDRSKKLVLAGREKSQSAAYYKAARAIFEMLLTAPYRGRLTSERITRHGRVSASSEQQQLRLGCGQPASVRKRQSEF